MDVEHARGPNAARRQIEAETRINLHQVQMDVRQVHEPQTREAAKSSTIQDADLRMHQVQMCLTAPCRLLGRPLARRPAGTAVPAHGSMTSELRAPQPQHILRTESASDVTLMS